MKSFLLVIFSFLFFSCAKEEVVIPVVEAEVLVEEVSPFEKLLGSWKVEFEVINHDTTFYENETDILHIEEDDNLTDSYAIGYFQRINNLSLIHI